MEDAIVLDEDTSIPGPPFPRLGMCCEVPTCMNMTVFRTYCQYRNHYVATHHRMKKLWKCTGCAKTFAFKRNSVAHTKHRNTPCFEREVTFQWVRNEEFVDPMAIPMPSFAKHEIKDVTKKELMDHDKLCGKTKRASCRDYATGLHHWENLTREIGHNGGL